MRAAAVLILSGLLCSASSQAAPGPATAPSADDDIPTLIGRLGDPEFRVRSDAANRLRSIGTPALPALKKAADDPNPDVRMRAKDIVHVLEFHHVPGRPANQRGLRMRSIHVSIVNGRQTVDVNDGGREITIVQGDDGIEMTVKGELDGRPDTETYKAPTADQLRTDNPEAYALYQRWGGALAGDMNMGIPGQGNLVLGPGNRIIGPGVIIRGNGNVLIAPQFRLNVRAGGDELGALRGKIDDALKKGPYTAEQKQRVNAAFARIEQAWQLNGLPDPSDDQMRDYEKACDDLRQTLKDLNLPDPGADLPPPRGARLGVSVAPDPLGNGIVISHVAPNSRAERMGLQDDDLIRKINGQDVTDIKDLRRLVTEHAKHITVDITRDGREMKVEEKTEK